MSVGTIPIAQEPEMLKNEHLGLSAVSTKPVKSFSDSQVSNPPIPLTHPTIKDGWFTEENDEWPGQALRLRVKKILHVSKSKYQDVLVFESTDYGNVLVLDGVIQVSERDEFAYQEMLAHLALNSHPNPRRVLVIGGGDGGVLREIVKHECVEQAILVEIDERVIDVSKRFLPDMASAFSHPKVKVHVGDGFAFLENVAKEKDRITKIEESEEEELPPRPPDTKIDSISSLDLQLFDVIITDSSDPEGPAAMLFQASFYKLLYNALTPNGIMSCQVSENQWLNLKLIRDLKKTCKTVFPVVDYSYTCVPTYTSGQLGIFVCAKDKEVDVRKPLRCWTKEEESRINKYYSSEMHSASFILPTWARIELDV